MRRLPLSLCVTAPVVGCSLLLTDASTSSAPPVKPEAVAIYVLVLAAVVPSARGEARRTPA